MNRTILKVAVKAVLEEALDNAKPLSDVMVKSLREDWTQHQIKVAMADAIEKQLVDITKNYDYYANKIVDLLEEAGDGS